MLSKGKFSTLFSVLLFQADLFFEIIKAFKLRIICNKAEQKFTNTPSGTNIDYVHQKKYLIKHIERNAGQARNTVKIFITKN